jgi:mannitol operon repressor
LEILFDLTNQPDRTAAIVGSAVLEDRLRRTILRHLRPDLTDDDQAMLFEDLNGPLSGFDAKARLSYALGILDKDTKTDFDNIRRIRNGFAHSIPHHSFQVPVIANMCKTSIS